MNKLLGLLTVAPFLIAFVIIGPLAHSDSPRDAIGVRIMPNPEHWSIQRWYQEHRFNGQPQSLLVDGYEAVRDGRTVYVNAGNITGGGDFYTNIFIISYNQEAEQPTVDIFGQILQFWKFNTNLPGAGTCSLDAALGCISDTDCPDKGFCSSSKAKLTRDVKRLSDLDLLNRLLEAYKKKNKRCPALEAGSYLPNTSLSAWPSWKSSLASHLGPLPTDPVNMLGPCPGFDAQTCWNEQTRAFGDPIADNKLDLPAGSRTYTYTSSANGNSCSMFTDFELISCPATAKCTVGGALLDIISSAPTIACGTLQGSEGGVLSGFVSASDPDGDKISMSIDTSGSAWTGWSAAPILKNSANPNSRQVYASKIGNEGSYNIIITATDTTGKSSSQACAIAVGGFVGNVKATDVSIDLGQTLTHKVIGYEQSKSYPLAFNFNAVSGPHTIPGLSCGATSPTIGETNGNYVCTLIKPMNYWPGTYAVAVQATDQNGRVMAGNFNLTINNYPPTTVSPLPLANGKPTLTLAASTTKAVNALILTATDNAASQPLAIVPAAGTMPGGLSTTTSVAGSSLSYALAGSVANTNIINVAQKIYSLALSAQDAYGYAAPFDFDIKITNSAPTVTRGSCPAVIRVKETYNCDLAGHDNENNAIVSFSSSGLASGLALNQSGNNALITGQIPVTAAGTYAMQVGATDEFGFPGSNIVISVKANTYCGDGAVQAPNSELAGGVMNDGQEQCDDGNNANGDGCKANCTPEPNFTCTGSPSVCTPNQQTVSCTPKPANTSWNSGGSVVQTWNGSIWLPSDSSAYSLLAAPCTYSCAAGFLWDGAICQPTQTAACTPKPANSSWNGASTINQAWDGTSWLPSNTSVYSMVAGACKFSCNAGYSWNGSSCAPPPPPPPVPFCGDGSCNGSENSSTCSADCPHTAAECAGAGGTWSNVSGYNACIFSGLPHPASCPAGWNGFQHPVTLQNHIFTETQTCTGASVSRTGNCGTATCNGTTVTSNGLGWGDGSAVFLSQHHNYAGCGVNPPMAKPLTVSACYNYAYSEPPFTWTYTSFNSNPFSGVDPDLGPFTVHMIDYVVHYNSLSCYPLITGRACR